jgi:hypothetical protein
MKPIQLIIIILFGLMLLVPIVSAADEYTEVQRGATMKNYVLVSLGFENIPGVTLTKATSFYNWVSVGFLFLVGSMSSKRMTRFFAMLIPIFAGMFVYLGWLQSPTPAATIGVIAMCGILGVVVYMKGSLKENFGTGGPGSLVMNIMFYMMILQAVVGLVNVSGVWVHDSNVNSGMTSSSYSNGIQNAPNADLSVSIEAASVGAGKGSTLLDSAGIMLKGLTSGFFTIIEMLAVALGGFSTLLLAIFPWLYQIPLAVQTLALFQIGIYACYAWFLYNLFAKSGSATEI